MSAPTSGAALDDVALQVLGQLRDDADGLSALEVRVLARSYLPTGDTREHLWHLGAERKNGRMWVDMSLVRCTGVSDCANIFPGMRLPATAFPHTFVALCKSEGASMSASMSVSAVAVYRGHAVDPGQQRCGADGVPVDVDGVPAIASCVPESAHALCEWTLAILRPVQQVAGPASG